VLTDSLGESQDAEVAAATVVVETADERDTRTPGADVVADLGASADEFSALADQLEAAA